MLTSMFIFIVAVLNLGLGFGIAVYLGRRYRELVNPDEWSAADFTVARPDQNAFSFSQESAVAEQATTEPNVDIEPTDTESTDTESTDTEPIDTEPIDTEPTDTEPTDTEPTDTEPPDTEPIDNEPPDTEPTDTEPPDTEPPDTEPTDTEPTEARAETELAEDVSPESQREKCESETMIEQFQDEVKQYHDRLEETDEKLRSSEDPSDAELVEACTASLLEATNQFLDSREKAHGNYRETCGEQPEFTAVNDNVQAAIERQDARIEAATAVFKAFDPKRDPNDSRQNVLSETAKLIDGNHQLRDSLDVALVSAGRGEEQLGEIDDGRSHDPLTGICSRAGLEAYLLDWWKKDPHHVRKLTVAMLDIDRFSKINEQYGHQVGDRILKAIAQLLEVERDDGDTVARLSGERFVYLAPDSDIRSTTNIVERVRQTVETTHFRYKEEDIQLTLSGAVAETVPQDTTDVLIGRAETTLQEAKRYGRNRTFIYEGKYPAPVVPPNFSLDEKTIDL